MKKFFYPLFFCVYSCSNPFIAFAPDSEAPSSPASFYTPMKNNRLVSSKYCDILLPKDFDSVELSLGELIDIALHNNPETKITWAEAKAQAANYGQSLSSYFPDIYGDGTYQRQRAATVLTSAFVEPYHLTTITPDLNLSYTLLDFGRRKNTSEAARQALYYADWNHNQEIQTIIKTVMDDYYDYLYQKEYLRALEEDLVTAEVTLDAANQKFRVGVADLGDVAQAKTKFLQSKINVIAEKRALENSFAKLAKDVGLPANLAFKMQNLPEKVFVDAVLDSVESLIGEAQEQRQDFLAEKANLKSKEADLKRAKSEYWPDVTTDLNIGRTWYGADQTDGYHWSMLFKINIPIFRGNYYVNGVKKAKALVEKSKAQLFDKELEIIKEVTTAHFDVKSAAETLVCSEDYLKEASQQYDISLGYYKAGTNTILDLLSAQSSVADARAKLADAKRSWYTSLANLAYSTGALCKPKDMECKKRST